MRRGGWGLAAWVRPVGEGADVAGVVSVGRSFSKGARAWVRGDLRIRPHAVRCTSVSWSTEIPHRPYTRPLQDLLSTPNEEGSGKPLTYPVVEELGPGSVIDTSIYPLVKQNLFQLCRLQHPAPILHAARDSPHSPSTCSACPASS